MNNVIPRAFRKETIFSYELSRVDDALFSLNKVIGRLEYISTCTDNRVIQNLITGEKLAIGEAMTTIKRVTRKKRKQVFWQRLVSLVLKNRYANR